MSRKRTKQYLMLLMVIGLVSIAAGGSGTFASFSAETTNAGNYFATGTLVLNDTGNTNTCTSATATGSVNSANSSGTDCDTLFKVNHFSFAATTLTLPTPLDNSATNPVSLTVAAITGAAIYPGDTLTISQGLFTDTMVAKSYAAVGDQSVDVDPTTLINSYTAGAKITDNSDTQIASLTLQNAGTIDAKDILVKAGGGCTPQYTEPNTTLNVGPITLPMSSTTTLTVASTGLARFNPGDTLIVSESGHANSFVVSSQTNATTIVVDASQPWNYAYTNAAVVSGPEFNGAGTPHDLCAHLQFSIVETDGTFPASLGSAQGCAYGTPSGATCDLTGGTALSSVLTTFAPLSINTSANSNTSGKLLAGKSRTFELVVHYDGVNTFDNTYQNTEAAAFDLTWHIDQV